MNVNPVGNGATTTTTAGTITRAATTRLSALLRRRRPPCTRAASVVATAIRCVMTRPMAETDEGTLAVTDLADLLAQEERYDEAYEDLTKMLSRAGRDAYLQAILNQALAQVEWARGQFEAALVGGGGLVTTAGTKLLTHLVGLGKH